MNEAFCDQLGSLSWSIWTTSPFLAPLREQHLKGLLETPKPLRKKSSWQNPLNVISSNMNSPFWGMWCRQKASIQTPKKSPQFKLYHYPRIRHNYNPCWASSHMFADLFQNSPRWRHHCWNFSQIEINFNEPLSATWISTSWRKSLCQRQFFSTGPNQSVLDKKISSNYAVGGILQVET